VQLSSAIGSSSHLRERHDLALFALHRRRNLVSDDIGFGFCRGYGMDSIAGGILWAPCLNVSDSLEPVTIAAHAEDGEQTNGYKPEGAGFWNCFQHCGDPFGVDYIAHGGAASAQYARDTML
jgi:hypothetical protein